MAEYDDQAGRAEAARVKKACGKLLLDLRKHELWPDEMDNPDIDRLPVFRAIRALVEQPLRLAWRSLCGDRLNCR
jgi:hypothetical protein